MNDIEFRFGWEDFYYGLLSPKCHNAVTIDCLHSNMRPFYYGSQPNSMKSTFVGNLIRIIKGKVLFMSRQICCRSICKATTFCAFVERTVSCVT